MTAILNAREANLDAIMRAMDASWRSTWCSGGVCGCMGCANASGGLLMHGYTKEEWQKWITLNPDLISKEAIKAEMDAFIASVKQRHQVKS